jgi:ribosome-associated protein
LLDPIFVRPGVLVPTAAMSVRATRSSGPGGQNVNKVSSKVELRVDLDRIEGLDAWARTRLASLCAASLDAEGLLLVRSQHTRDRQRNLADAQDKVRALVLRALIRPSPRTKTRPTRGSVERRLEDKRRRSSIKRGRHDGSD